METNTFNWILGSGVFLELLLCVLMQSNWKNPQNQDYGSADKQNVKGIYILRLAVSGKANPLTSHVMGGGEGGREEEQEKKCSPI